VCRRNSKKERIMLRSLSCFYSKGGKERVTNEKRIGRFVQKESKRKNKTIQQQTQNVSAHSLDCDVNVMNQIMLFSKMTKNETRKKRRLMPVCC